MRVRGVCVDWHYGTVDVEDFRPIDDVPAVQTSEEINRIERANRKQVREPWYF